MKKIAGWVLLTSLFAWGCSSEYDVYCDKMKEQMHAESCSMELVEQKDGANKLHVMEIDLHNVDTAFFHLPAWIVHSYAAQEFYFDAITQVNDFDAVKVKFSTDDDEGTSWNFPMIELKYADSLYTRAEKMINDQNGLAGMIKYRDQFDTVITNDIFGLIDQAIAESEQKNGKQTALFFGGYRRVRLEYMDTPVFQVVVQQRRVSNTDYYIFSFSERTGLVMSLQLNGTLE